MALRLLFVSFLVATVAVPMTSAECNTSILYDMTNGFLDVIQPDSHVDELGKLLDLDSESFFDAVLQGQSLNTSVLLSALESNWSKLAESYVGFIICFLIGVIIIIGMAVGCCCFGPRRLCGACGAGIKKKPEQENDKFKRVLIGIVVIVFVGLAAGGIACTFLAEEALTSQLKATSDSDSTPHFINSIIRYVDLLIVFVNDLLQVVGNLLKGDEFQELIKSLEGIVSDVLANLRTEFNAIISDTTPFLDAVKNDLNEINSSTTDVQQRAAKLTSDQAQLSTTLADISAETKTAIQSCATPECNALKTSIDTLNTGDTYAFPDLSPALDKIHNVQTTLSDIDLSFQFPNTTASLTDAVNKSVSLLHDELTQLDLSQTINLTAQLKKHPDEISSISDNGGDVAYNVSIALSCYLIGVLVFILLGLLWGAFSKPAKDSSSTFHRGTAEKCFVAGAGSAFLISWLVMIIVSICFLIGGLTYVEICRDIQKETKPEWLQEADNALRKVATVPSFVNLAQLSVHDIIYVECKDDNSLFAASSSFFRIVDFDKLLDEYVDLDIFNETIDEIIPPNAFVELDNLPSTLSSMMYFPDFETALNQPVTEGNLAAIATDMDNALVSDASLTALTGLADRVRQADSTMVASMNDNIAAAKTSLSAVKTKLQSASFNDSVNDLIANLRQLQSQVKAQSNSQTAVISSKLAEKIRNQLGKFSETARCRQLYDSFQGVLCVFCGEVLNPFNAFWFSYGWAITMFIPIIIFGVWLGGLYARKPPVETRLAGRMRRQQRRTREIRDRQSRPEDRYRKEEVLELPERDFQRPIRPYSEFNRPPSSSLPPSPVRPQFPTRPPYPSRPPYPPPLPPRFPGYPRPVVPPPLPYRPSNRFPSPSRLPFSRPPLTYPSTRPPPYRPFSRGPPVRGSGFGMPGMRTNYNTLPYY